MLQQVSISIKSMNIELKIYDSSFTHHSIRTDDSMSKLDKITLDKRMALNCMCVSMFLI